MAKERVNGYVVGSNHGGKEWVIRVRDESHWLNEHKIVVSTVRVGTQLRPGLDVTFQIDDSGHRVVDVAAAPRVEATKVAATNVNKDVDGDDAPYLSAMVISHRSGFCFSFTGATSVEEAREWLEDMGADDDERVVDVITMRHQEGDDGEAAIRTLSAMMEIGDAYPDSICQTLERFLLEVFSAGVRHGQNQTSKGA